MALALFIIPFFVFSALAGQVADKYDKARLMQIIKAAEVLIMIVAAIGFFHQQVYLLLFALFCMGLHSTFFGPLKYSIIPQHLKDDELVSGNALVEMGTFLAILLGSVAGVVLKMGHNSPTVISTGLLTVAGLGLLSSLLIPKATAAEPGLRLNWNLARETWHIIGFAREVRSVWLCVLGISWFWFLGAAYTTQLKRFVDVSLHGTDGLYALLLTTFSIGIGAGSILYEKTSGKKARLSWVPVAAACLSLFGIDLYFAPIGFGSQPTSMAGFLHLWAGWHILVDLLAIGIFGGMYIVPLFSYIQKRSNSHQLSRIIAANNILNSLFMVLSAAVALLLLNVAGLSIPAFFLVLALANLLVAGLYLRSPAFRRSS
jgi:MFS family permease